MRINIISLVKYFHHDIGLDKKSVELLLHFVHFAEDDVLVTSGKHLLKKLTGSAKNELLGAVVELYHSELAKVFHVDVCLRLLALLDSVGVNSLEFGVANENSRIDKVY